MCALARLIGLIVAMAACSYAAAQTATNDYARLCSGCHGDRFSTPSRSEVAGRSETELAAVIRSGMPVKGMPAFGAQLSEPQIEGLAQLIRTSVASARVGVSIPATTLDRAHSAGYVIMSTQRQPPTRFAGYFSERSSLCYADVDLTGARSIELTYARGDTDPARFAILIGNGKQTPRINLGEKAATSTGGWENFERIRVGLNQEVTGRHLLCFYGVKGGGIFNLESFALSERPGEHDGVTVNLEAAAEPVSLLAAISSFWRRWHKLLPSSGAWPFFLTDPFSPRRRMVC